MATLTDEDLNRIEADVSLVVAAKVERLRAEVERLRDGIKEHRDRVLQRERNGAFIHRGTHAQSPNERLWELLDGAT